MRIENDGNDVRIYSISDLIIYNSEDNEGVYYSEDCRRILIIKNLNNDSLCKKLLKEYKNKLDVLIIDRYEDKEFTLNYKDLMNAIDVMIIHNSKHIDDYHLCGNTLEINWDQEKYEVDVSEYLSSFSEEISAEIRKCHHDVSYVKFDISNMHNLYIHSCPYYYLIKVSNENKEIVLERLKQNHFYSSSIIEIKETLDTDTVEILFSLIESKKEEWLEWIDGNERIDI